MNDHARIQSLYLRINELSQRGAFDAVKECCEELIRVAPQDGVAWYCLGEIAIQRGEVAEGIRALQKATVHAPENMQYLRSLAVAFLRHGQWEESARMFRQVLVGDTRDATSWRNLAFAETMLGRPEQAALAYERCLAIVPDRDDIAVEYADSLYRMGEANRSLAVAQSVTARNPTYAPAWAVMGTALLLLQNWANAVSACQNAIRLDPQNRQACLLLAIALMRLWLLPEAEAVVRRLVGDEPQNANAWALLGTLLKMQAKTAEATGQDRRGDWAAKAGGRDWPATQPPKFIAANIAVS